MSYYVLDAAYRSEESNGTPRGRCVVAGTNAGDCRLPDGANAWGVLGVTTHAQDVEGAAVTVRRLGVAQVEASAAIARGDAVVVSGLDGRVRSASGPAASIGSAGANNAIDFALRNALAGNGIVQVTTEGAGENSPLSASVSGETITISLATDGGGSVTSTAAEVIAFANSDPVTAPLIKASSGSGSSGAGVCAEATVVFTGGLDSLNRIGIAEGAASAAGDLVDVLLTP